MLVSLNLEKCDFGKPDVKLVGHIVESGCKKADPERTQAMSEMARPSTKGKLRKFLGAMGYYSLRGELTDFERSPVGR